VSSHGHAYIDGFNLYFGLRDSGLRHLLWLDVRKMAALVAPRGWELGRVVYGTARISGAQPTDSEPRGRQREESRRRQTVYLDALSAAVDLEILEGHFLPKTVTCYGCRRSWAQPEEKMTDVQLATEMLTDVFVRGCQRLLVISADSDLVPPIKAIRSLRPEVEVIVAFPPGRVSTALQNEATGIRKIRKKALETAQLPDPVEVPGNVFLSRPSEWTERNRHSQ